MQSIATKTMPVQYFMIGSSLLEMNKSTGDVYLNGELDAESEQEIKFYCYPKDLAQGPLSKQTEMVEFTILVKDVDEFRPILQPPSSFIVVKRMSQWAASSITC